MIQIIAGTNRPDSNTLKIAKIVEGIYKELNVQHNLFSLKDLPRDLFLPESYENKPAAFEPIAKSIVEASGLVIVTPEYNGSVPGVLKYFIDHLPFPESFESKPVCFIGLAAGMWGALRPVEQLQMIFGYRNAFLYSERVFIPGIGNQLDDKDQLKSNDILDRLKGQAKGFSEFVKKLKS
jgi:NAD(P)H-dependent FMN reductase